MIVGGFGKAQVTLAGDPTVVNGNPAVLLRVDGRLGRAAKTSRSKGGALVVKGGVDVDGHDHLTPRPFWETRSAGTGYTHEVTVGLRQPLGRRRLLNSQGQQVVITS
ncbi:hypothetical protein [Nonomuraea sp. bgisy101]|uniref:hypothetical protein n=1 Tax=Nonomuraea sp. bgisy101 TaxID=3413784 RepID=UPI003D74AF68